MALTAPADKSITLSEILSDSRKVDVEWMGHEFWVRYRLSAFSEELFEHTGKVALSNGMWGAAAFREAIKFILVEWSIKDEHGIMVPIDDETLRPMSITLMSTIYDACQEDQRPKAKSESSSSDTSKPTATKAG